MSISGIYSLSNELKESETTLSTGYVDIELKEYNGNNEPFTEDGTVVMPGESIQLIPRVNNLGSECYLRTKITYKINGKDFNILDYIEGNYSTWPRDGEYYYYGSILNKNESIDIFNLFKVPSNLTNEYQGKDIVINIVVDAIQAKNFDGNWQNVEILESIDKSYDISGEGSSTIIYENGTEDDIDINETFFDSLGGLLPGDSISDIVNIQNNSNNKNIYYLSLDNDLNNEEKRLLESFKLIIKNSKGETIANKTLNYEDKIQLGILDPNEKETYTIEVSLPSTANNTVSKLLAKIKWKFSLENFDERNPQTGDFKIDTSITVFIISSIGLLIVLLLWKRENDREEENKI